MKTILTKLYQRDFREKLIKNPKQHLNELYNVTRGEDIEYAVSTCTKSVTYIAIPHESHISDIQQLSAINAAGNSSTASSVGTVSSAFTLSTTFGSVGSAGSIGSVEIK